MEDYIARHYPPPRYAILKVIPSNLLPDIEEESLVFLEDTIQSAGYSGPEPVIGELLCVYVGDGRTQEHVFPKGGDWLWRESTETHSKL